MSESGTGTGTDTGTQPEDVAYAAFVPTYAEFAQPISEDALESEIRDLLDAPEPAAIGLGADALRTRVLAGLNIGFLVDDLQRSPLRVQFDGEGFDEDEPFRTSRVRLQQAGLGTLEVTLLEPRDADDPMPAAIGLHGHNQDANDFARQYLGAELASRGYVVALPFLKAMQCDDLEHETSRHLLRNGFTLMGIRVYETLLVARFLRERPDVDPDRIALLGHSGGSSAGNLVVRITDTIAATVSDFETDYRDLCGSDVHCETIPDISPLSADINDQQTLPIPHLEVPYDYDGEESRQNVLEFLDDALGQ